MITQEELNSRIVEDSDKILLIFEDYRRLNLYRRNFGREDLIDSPYGYDIDDNIEIFMTIRQMIEYNNLQSQLKEKEEVIKEAREYIETNTCWDLRTSKMLEILSKGENK